jgi:trehalose synthase
MLHKVTLGVRDISKYRLLISGELIDEIEKLADELKGIRICHINSTPFGGGVAELLSSYIPLVRSLGLHIDWQAIHGDRRFFIITKSIHNALQGGDGHFIEREETQRVYKSQNLENARELDCNYDVFIVNDPQPAALRHFCDEARAKWLWRCHVDSSEPNLAVWQFLRPYVEEYDAAIFTMERFVPPDLSGPRIATMAPAIDPFSSKNMPLPRTLCRELIENLGIDHNRPLILQVSRFDQWKDPFGVIRVYRIVKEKVPGLQLALVGSLANDDPEGMDMYAAIHKEAEKDKDIYVFSNLTGVGSMEVNVFQTACTVAIQKSLREGFGLVVSESLWKETPMVAGNAGGIPLQMAGRLSQYLVSSEKECAEKVLYLLEHPELGEELGREGKEHIKRNFLMPRLIKDELSLIKSLFYSGSDSG